MSQVLRCNWRQCSILYVWSQVCGNNFKGDSHWNCLSLKLHDPFVNGNRLGPHRCRPIYYSSRCIYLCVPEYGRRPPFPLNSAGCAAKTLLNVVFEEGSGRRIGDHQAGQAILRRCIIEDSNGNVSQVERVLKDQNSIRRESEGTQDSETAWELHCVLLWKSSVQVLGSRK